MTRIRVTSGALSALREGLDDLPPADEAARAAIEARFLQRGGARAQTEKDKEPK